MSNNDLIYICLAGTVVIAGLLVITLHLFRRRIRRRRLLERTILWQFPMLDPNGRASNGPPVLPLVTGDGRLVGHPPPRFSWFFFDKELSDRKMKADAVDVEVALPDSATIPPLARPEPARPH
ncbi:hypothetical protein C8J57DRAFT_1241193 [Mycena rebaudengoi]|nr:hypothetical protein C8J57DRAFT_1241193 [Mycena rebaudengoi]